MAHMNHLEAHLASAFEFVGITRIHTVAIEGQEAGGDVLAKSIADATRNVERLVDELQVAVNATPRKAVSAIADSLDTA
ncbi:NAD(P)H dehydrogenase (quinone) [Salinisphaera shabanensis T35B1]